MKTVVEGTPQVTTEPSPDNLFLCPICFKYFPEEAVDANLISLEHVPPKAVGGKVRTLTCRTCNNEAGTRLDSKLQKHLNFIEFDDNIPKTELEIKYSLNDSVFLPATLSQSPEGNLIIAGQPHRSNPKDLERIMQNPPQNANQMTFRLQIPTYERHSRAAILRIAYLYAFSVLGYSFLMNPNLGVIRGQIRYPDESILPSWGIIRNEKLPDELVGINAIREPKELRSWLVIFDLKTSKDSKSRWGALLPAPTQPGLSIYQWLSENQGMKFNQQITHFNDINFPEKPFASYDIWSVAH